MTLEELENKYKFSSEAVQDDLIRNTFLEELIKERIEDYIFKNNYCSQEELIEAEEEQYKMGRDDSADRVSFLVETILDDICPKQTKAIELLENLLEEIKDK